MSASKAAAAGLTAAMALGLALSSAHVAGAQDAPASPTPPSPETLARCAQLPSDDARLACYDAAMRSAGYGPKPGEVAAEHRKQFGLPLSKLNVLKHHDKEKGRAAAGHRARAKAAPEENPDQVTVRVQEAIGLKPVNRMLVVTDDGQIWEQIDQTEVSSFPSPGSDMKIRRGVFGSYFCSANKYQDVRCKRDR